MAEKIIDTGKISGLEKILDIDPKEDPVISVYLQVDRARVNKNEYLSSLNSMITRRRAEVEKDEVLTKNNKRKIISMMDRIKAYYNDKFMTGSTKTSVIFARADDLWEEFRLPIVMKSKIIIDPKPYTQDLRSAFKNYKKYGVLLIDREKAQIYSIYLEEVREYLAAIISDVPSKVNFRSNAVLREKKILGRIEEKLHGFFKIVNDRTLELFKENRFDYLILAGRKDIIPNFYNYLHSYLQSKYIGSIVAEPDSGTADIRDKALHFIKDFEDRTKDGLIDRLLDEHNPGGLGVLGIEATIRALIRDQVKILIYNNGFMHKGYVCEDCLFITTGTGRACPYCGSSKLVLYNDIVDEMVEMAINQGSDIVDVDDNERLREAGNIGAVLRYKM
ncbi:MAG: hypothetical protein JW770_05960 [Actinobacteria bacterium]|nr:hypothetical protein [Actinomycetota bacterium]